jgi:hypothetical protein
MTPVTDDALSVRGAETDTPNPATAPPFVDPVDLP